MSENLNQEKKVKMGADGTPTSYIDVIAEDQVINILKNAPIHSYIISEEIGELKVGYGKKRKCCFNSGT